MVLGLAAVMLISACGQKGPLELPLKPPPNYKPGPLPPSEQQRQEKREPA